MGEWFVVIVFWTAVEFKGIAAGRTSNKWNGTAEVNISVPKKKPLAVKSNLETKDWKKFCFLTLLYDLIQISCLSFKLPNTTRGHLKNTRKYYDQFKRTAFKVKEPISVIWHVNFAMSVMLVHLHKSVQDFSALVKKKKLLLLLDIFKRINLRSSKHVSRSGTTGK